MGIIRYAFPERITHDFSSAITKIYYFSKKQLVASDLHNCFNNVLKKIFEGDLIQKENHTKNADTYLLSKSLSI